MEWVEQCRANDRKAQMQLYRQYCGGMFAVAMRFVGNAQDAEDVVQESFIKAFVRLDQYRGEVSFGAWLKRIVVNGSIDHLKSKHHGTESLDETDMVHIDQGDWEEDRDISLDRVGNAIGELPGKYRYVVQLFLVEGYDHGEISQILEISESASRTRLLRGKALVRDKLKDMVYGSRS